MPNDQHSFGPDDVDLLVRAMALVPDLQAAAMAAKIANETKLYPIADPSALLAVFNEAGGVIVLGTHKIDYDHVKRFLPAEWFPIEDERQLLTRVFLAFRRGEMAHTVAALLDRSAERPPQGEIATVLPAPALTFGDALTLAKL